MYKLFLTGTCTLSPVMTKSLGQTTCVPAAWITVNMPLSGSVNGIVAAPSWTTVTTTLQRSPKVSRSWPVATILDTCPTANWHCCPYKVGKNKLNNTHIYEFFLVLSELWKKVYSPVAKGTLVGPEGLLAGTRNRVVGMAPPPVGQAYNMALVAVVASYCWIPIHYVHPIPCAIARPVLLGASPLLLDSS